MDDERPTLSLRKSVERNTNPRKASIQTQRKGFPVQLGQRKPERYESLRKSEASRRATRGSSHPPLGTRNLRVCTCTGEEHREGPGRNRWWPCQHILPLKPTIKSEAAAQDNFQRWWGRRPSPRSHTESKSVRRTLKHLENPSIRAGVQKESRVIICNHLSAPFVNKEIANLGISVRSSIPKRVETNQRSEIILWQSPKHGPKQEKETTSLKLAAKGKLLHGVSAIPVIFFLQNMVENDMKNVSTIAPRATFCSRSREERPHVGCFSTKWRKWSKSELIM